MTVRCINPTCFQGDPEGAPEYESDNPMECGECGYIIDLDDEPWLEMDDNTLRCEDCMVACRACGASITDEAMTVYLRCLRTGRTELWCMECAAQDWIDRLVDYHRETASQPWQESEYLHTENIEKLYAFYATAGAQ